MRRVWFVLAAVTASVVAIGAQKQNTSKPVPVSVFVTSIGAADGFTEPSKENLDAVKDLRYAITHNRKKTLTVVDKREDATIVLVVMSRIYENKRFTEHVKLHFKDMERELTVASAPKYYGGWTPVAEMLAEQVAEWVIANRTKLTEAAK